MEIKRDIYLNKLISKRNNGLIKVVTGVRRCGKSYLLFTLFKNYLLSAGIDEQHIIEIAFDAFETDSFVIRMCCTRTSKRRFKVMICTMCY